MWQIFSTSLFGKILEKCSDTVNAQTNTGETALHFALASRSKTATNALLNHKDLNVNIVAYDGEMPIHQAAKWKSIDFEAFEIIVRKTENLSTKRILFSTSLKSQNCQLSQSY